MLAYHVYMHTRTSPFCSGKKWNSRAALYEIVLRPPKRVTLYKSEDDLVHIFGVHLLPVAQHFRAQLPSSSSRKFRVEGSKKDTLVWLQSPLLPSLPASSTLELKDV